MKQERSIMVMCNDFWGGKNTVRCWKSFLSIYNTTNGCGSFTINDSSFKETLIGTCVCVAHLKNTFSVLEVCFLTDSAFGWWCLSPIRHLRHGRVVHFLTTPRINLRQLKKSVIHFHVFAEDVLVAQFYIWLRCLVQYFWSNKMLSYGNKVVTAGQVWTVSLSPQLFTPC
jgi:hypothetical protein